jgi:hypothetical protein
MVLPQAFQPREFVEMAAAIGWVLPTEERAIWAFAAVGIAAGIVAGGVIGAITGGAAAWRRPDLASAPAGPDGDAASTEELEIARRLAREYPDGSRSMRYVSVRPQSAALLAVGELTVRSARVPPTAQTAVLWAPDALRFPFFLLQPADVMPKLLAKMLGNVGMKFPENRGFAERFLVLAKDARLVQPLFDGSLMAVLEAHPGFTVESGPGSLLVYRQKELLPAEEIDAFVREVSEIIVAFERAARVAR